MTTTHEIPLQPFSSLDEALEALLHGLNLIAPLRLWMVTRVSGDDWSVLHSQDRDKQIKRGKVFRWSDSYCSKMVRGEGPMFAENAQAIPVYRQAGINKQMIIGTYIGLPLTSEDGTLLGTVCGVDPDSQAGFTPQQKQMVEIFTRTISSLLVVWLKLEKARQAETQLLYHARTDSLTGLSNRNAWDAAVIEEEAAFESLSENALVLVVDLDGLKEVNDTQGHAAGDKYLVQAAKVLQQQLREADIVARLGGDEFAAVVPNVPAERGAAICERVRQAFRDAGIEASIGHAMRLTYGSLEKALQAADAHMYQNKISRKQA